MRRVPLAAFVETPLRCVHAGMHEEPLSGVPHRPPAQHVTASFFSSFSPRAQAADLRERIFSIMGRERPTECPVCAEELDFADCSGDSSGGGLVMLRCLHCLHGACMLKWFLRDDGVNVSCPVCRGWVTSLTPDDAAISLRLHDSGGGRD